MDTEHDAQSSRRYKENWDEAVQMLNKADTQTEYWRLIAGRAERLAITLEQYANPLNWAEDGTGIRRVWLEPDSTTPDAYNGFEAARAALKPN